MKKSFNLSFTQVRPDVRRHKSVQYCIDSKEGLSSFVVTPYFKRPVNGSFVDEENKEYCSTHTEAVYAVERLKSNGLEYSRITIKQEVCTNIVLFD